MRDNLGELDFAVDIRSTQEAPTFRCLIVVVQSSLLYREVGFFLDKKHLSSLFQVSLIRKDWEAFNILTLHCVNIAFNIPTEQLLTDLLLMQVNHLKCIVISLLVRKCPLVSAAPFPVFPHILAQDGCAVSLNLHHVWFAMYCMDNRKLAIQLQLFDHST